MLIVQFTKWLAIAVILSHLFGCTADWRNEFKKEQSLDEEFPADFRTFAKSEVDSYFGTKGQLIRPAGWPKRLADLPQYAEERDLFDLDQQIDWVIWRPIPRHKWIAVGFARAVPGGQLSVKQVVTIRSGVHYDLPDVAGK